MYLYNIEDNYLQVYEFKLDENKAKEFRVKELLKIPKEERLYKAATNKEGFLVTEKEPIWSILNKGFNHIMDNYEDNAIISKYVNGVYKDKQVVKSPCFNGNYKYLLLTQNHYKIDSKNQIRTMKGIISLPSSLYKLQLLEQGEFSLVKDMPIKEVLKLFNLSPTPVSRFSLDKINQAMRMGVINNENLAFKGENGVDATSKIVQLIKEYRYK